MRIKHLQLTTATSRKAKHRERASGSDHTIWQFVNRILQQQPEPPRTKRRKQVGEDGLAASQANSHGRENPLGSEKPAARWEKGSKPLKNPQSAVMMTSSGRQVPSRVLQIGSASACQSPEVARALSNSLASQIVKARGQTLLNAVVLISRSLVLLVTVEPGSRRRMHSTASRGRGMWSLRRATRQSAWACTTACGSFRATRFVETTFSVQHSTWRCRAGRVTGIEFPNKPR